MAVAQPVQWNGTPDEYMALLTAIGHNCGCNRAMGVLMGDPCGAHQMLNDQKACNNLVFGRRMSAALQEEEFCE